MILPANIEADLKTIAKQLGLSNLILFGSRATGRCWERSDIDLAANFENAEQYFEFIDAIEEIPTLLMFDVIDLNSDMIDLDVRKSIADEGVVIYEKI